MYAESRSGRNANKTGGLPSPLNTKVFAPLILGKKKHKVMLKKIESISILENLFPGLLKISRKSGKENVQRKSNNGGFASLIAESEKNSTYILKNESSRLSIYEKISNGKMALTKDAQNISHKNGLISKLTIIESGLKIF